MGLHTKEPAWKSSPAWVQRAGRGRCACSCGHTAAAHLGRRSLKVGGAIFALCCWPEAQVTVILLPKRKEPAANGQHGHILETCARGGSWLLPERTGSGGGSWDSAERPGARPCFGSPDFTFLSRERLLLVPGGAEVTDGCWSEPPGLFSSLLHFLAPSLLTITPLAVLMVTLSAKSEGLDVL